MSLKEELWQDMKCAMKKKEAGKTELSVIRSVRSAVRNAEIDGKCELDDTGVGSVIAKEMKQRKGKKRIPAAKCIFRPDAARVCKARISNKHPRKGTETSQLNHRPTGGLPDFKQTSP